ncbi:MAG TPA: endonuclease/exonuclease/phosphatase family protein [Mycobacterium sp.]|nr:endonuclease/exonuclease/phosphatase family protein [Mycobacterium sp.]
MTAVAAVATTVALSGLVARYLPVDGHVVLVLAAASPYLMAAGPVGMLLFGLAQRWVPALLAACLCVVMLGVQAPRYLGPEPISMPAATVRVMTANLGMGQADSRAVAAFARESADVLVLQEMTPEAATGLSSAGLDDVFAHRVIDPRPLASGIGVWSRYPIVESGGLQGYSLPLLWARLSVPGVVTDPTVVAVHLAAPWPQPIEDWRRDIARFVVTLRELADDAGAGAVIAAGDLNATIDMAPFRRLLNEGYRDAAEQAGAGLTRTYPSQRWRPPMLGIDHVLVYGCAATSARTMALPGSDHQGLVATVDVPVDPTAS